MPLLPLLSQINPVNTLRSCVCGMHFDAVLPSALKYSKLSLPCRFPHHIPLSFHCSPIRATCPGRLIFLDLLTRKVSGDFSFFCPGISQHPTLDPPSLLSLYSFISARNQVSHPYKQPSNYSIYVRMYFNLYVISYIVRQKFLNQMVVLVKTDWRAGGYFVGSL
jgi:hypothetical protein